VCVRDEEEEGIELHSSNLRGRPSQASPLDVALAGFFPLSPMERGEMDGVRV